MKEFVLCVSEIKTKDFLVDNRGNIVVPKYVYEELTKDEIAIIIKVMSIGNFIKRSEISKILNITDEKEISERIKIICMLCKKGYLITKHVDK